MALKKSLARAMERAYQHSIQFPDLTVWVLDRPYAKAVVSTVDWCCRCRITEGYHIHATFVNGKRI